MERSKQSVLLEATFSIVGRWPPACQNGMCQVYGQVVNRQQREGGSAAEGSSTERSVRYVELCIGYIHCISRFKSFYSTSPTPRMKGGQGFNGSVAKQRGCQPSDEQAEDVMRLLYAGGCAWFCFAKGGGNF